MPALGGASAPPARSEPDRFDGLLRLGGVGLGAADAARADRSSVLSAGLDDEALTRLESDVAVGGVERDRAFQAAEDLPVRVRVGRVAVAGAVAPRRHRVARSLHLLEEGVGAAGRHAAATGPDPPLCALCGRRATTSARFAGASAGRTVCLISEPLRVRIPETGKAPWRGRGGLSLFTPTRLGGGVVFSLLRAASPSKRGSG